MRRSTRRAFDVVAVMGGGLLAGGVAVVGAFLGHTEQVANMWVRAELADDGSAQVTEVIDYDFGSSVGKHGIFRVVPGLSPEAPISVSSDDAPDDLDVTTEPEGTRLRIGDPYTTVSGDRRYRIEYPLDGVAVGTRLAWDAVGTEWEVGIAAAEIHVVAPYELLDPRCFEGGAGSTDVCQVRQVEPGHLVVTVDGLDAGQGVTLEARTGSDLAAPPAAPDAPTDRPDHPGTGLIPPAVLAVLTTLVGGVLGLLAVRRAGRERVGVGAGGPADTAWAAGEDGPLSEVRLDQAELRRMSTIEFAPPGELRAAQGGVVLDEEVKPNHKVAWLIEAAIEGSVEFVYDGDGDGVDDRAGYGGHVGPPTQLVRRTAGSPETSPILDAAFGGRDELPLGTYDPSFATAWGQLDGRLSDWQATSGLWDERAERRRPVIRALGLLGFILGLAVVGAGAAAANAWGPGWLPLVAPGGLLAGAGLAATVAGWELHVRTVTGSAAWLRVESFRRFLAESEAYHAEEAARRGVLRDYTAWAVAVGEIDRWSRAVQASTAIPPDSGVDYVYTAPFLYGAMASTATAPSSSSSGGGFGGFSGGGSVGGGAGGGGGGSW